MTAAQVTLVVRDHEICRFAHVDEWDATSALAGVSSDPRSFRELCLAWHRYREDSLESLAWTSFTEWTDDDAGGDWLLIDMACFRIESNSRELLPEQPGAYQRDDGPWTVEMPFVWLNFPPNWRRTITVGRAPEFHSLGIPVEPLDYRGILFGRAMATDLAKRMILLEQAEDCPAEYLRVEDLPRGIDRHDPRRKVLDFWKGLTVKVHAAWLMTPRDDLGGETPRKFLHSGRAWVEREILNREQDWSQLKTPPRSLDRDTHTYVFGPMGRDEVVVYFSFCREVIHAGWEYLQRTRSAPRNVDQCAAVMYEHGQTWLKSGQIEGFSTPPREMIETSRRHMPALAEQGHLDCDCPICRMMAEDDQFYPAFGGFDGFHLEYDGEFAFSLCGTREEWEEQEATYADFEDDDDPPRNDVQPTPSDIGDSVWDGHVEDGPLASTTLGLAFRVAELVGDLQRGDAPRERISALNEAFDGLRRASDTVPDRRRAADAMKDELERLAQWFPDLVGKSSDLQSKVDQWLRQSVDGTAL